MSPRPDDGAEHPSSMSQPITHSDSPLLQARRGRALAAAELAIATLLVVLDVLLPALVLVVLAAGSLVVRRERPASLGVRPLRAPGRMAAQVLGLTVAWTALQLSLLMPVVEHASGERQDVGAFAEVEGNLTLLLVLLALSWTLGAVVEELAFRGYVFTRAAALFSARWAPCGASLIAAVLFGLIHTEQGVVGVALTTVDGLFFAWLRLRFGSVWAAVLAHGFNNTIGLTAYFLVGPIYALW
jgi:CAAX protease family protein